VNTPESQRIPKMSLMKKTGVKDVRTLNKYIEEAEKQLEVPDKYDPDEAFFKNYKRIDAALMKACERGSPGALKIFYQLAGRLIERSENLNIDLTADDIFNIRQRARRELKEDGFLGWGTGEVPDKPVILPEKIWEDTG
jgi:hypothetical protein